MTYKCKACKDTGLCFDIKDLDPVEGYKMADRKIPCSHCRKEKKMERRITTKTIRKNAVIAQLERFLNSPIKAVSGVTLKVTLEDGTSSSFIYDGNKVITASSSGDVKPEDGITTEVKSQGFRGGAGTEA